MKASIIALVGAAAAVSAQSNGTVPYTTSTVYSTRTSTISECAETITNCPYKTHPVTTEIVDVYTTYCPVAATETSAPASSPPAAPWTTSTVYQTETLTISKCAPTVTNCPYTTKPITVVTSSAVSTTVCPPETTGPAGPPPPGKPSGSVIPPPKSLTQPGGPVSPSKPAGILSTITISTCVPSYITSVITVTPSSTPIYTYTKPSGPSSSGGVVVPPKSNSTITFTGAASSTKAGGLLMAVGLVAALL